MAKKPDKKVEKTEQHSSVAVKKSSEDTKETKDHVDGLSAEKESTKEEEISKSPEVKTENVEGKVITLLAIEVLCNI